jgi:hypothetical protein
MLEMLMTLGRTMGFSFAAGINLYATVAILGLSERFGWVALPAQFRVFDNDYIIAAALALYVVEFVADKVPWLDTLWDAVHTLIRPAGGALIAVAALGHASPTMEVMVGLLGGTLAAGTHFTKAGTRAVANTSPEPFSNWALSLAEDVFVVGLSTLAMTHPLAAAVVVIIGMIGMAWGATWIVRGVRRRWRREPEVRSQKSEVRS